MQINEAIHILTEKLKDSEDQELICESLLTVAKTLSKYAELEEIMGLWIMRGTVIGAVNNDFSQGYKQAVDDLIELRENNGI